MSEQNDFAALLQEAHDLATGTRCTVFGAYALVQSTEESQTSDELGAAVGLLHSSLAHLERVIEAIDKAQLCQRID